MIPLDLLVALFPSFVLFALWVLGDEAEPVQKLDKHEASSVPPASR